MTDPGHRQFDAQFDRALDAARDRSVANLRSAADHRRVEQLARNIHASFQGESQADSLLAIIRVLGVWLRSHPPDLQLTMMTTIPHLILQEVLGPNPADEPDAAA